MRIQNAAAFCAGVPTDLRCQPYGVSIRGCALTAGGNGLRESAYRDCHWHVYQVSLSRRRPPPPASLQPVRTVTSSTSNMRETVFFPSIWHRCALKLLCSTLASISWFAQGLVPSPALRLLAGSVSGHRW